MKRYVIFVVLFMMAFLTACGGSSPSAASVATPVDAQSPSGVAATVSPPAGGPTSLRVTRTDPSATNNLGPLDRTITDVRAVRSLYAMALKSPAYPTGTSISQSCLNDPGVIYHLDFLQGSASVQRMNLDPGSCKILYFSQTDLRQVSNDFLTLLIQALQVKSLTAN